MTKVKTEIKTLTGAQIFIECLKAEGVDVLFGYPGGVILHIYDELYKCEEIKHYLVRHEQGAIHAAEGYTRVTGRPGVALVTSGPGACNTITGLANAYYDGYPLVVFTGQVASTLIGGDAFQEADVVGITMPCCKHNYLVKDTKDLPRVIKEAFHIAMTGKPGPVVVDMPKDILTNKAEFIYPEKVKLPGYNPNYNGHPLQVAKALNLLCKAERPLIMCGGGVIAADASEELIKLAKALNIPVANTLMGTGGYPGTDELSLGLVGMHGNYWANLATANCDVLLAVGARFSDRVTGKLSKFCADAKVIHIDIDPCSISKNVPVDIPIVGDAKRVIADMLNIINTEEIQKKADKKAEWLHQINIWKQKRVKSPVKTEKMNPQTVIERIYELTKDKDAIICTEVGQHQMWTGLIYKFDKPRRFVTSGGLGTMGFGFPAAVGAKVACPDKPVINIAGDGSIQMNIQELGTCMQNNIGVKVFIINNGYLGMVRQWQERLFDKHYSHTHIESPDYVKLAEAYGATGIRVTKEEEIEAAVNRALETDGPVFVDFIVDSMEAVFPWVLAGEPICNVLMGKEGCEEIQGEYS
ncbi:MAG: acetolactate synthase, large subunit, biosynthetic type [Candidatus Melainabacteria bacterium GWF2_37_15]|nr:MAG: acetolactate synthase, large subunit, biosynthetic type [Candidatus Melainabacteria bacterium GWF2_37_15]